jgi:protein SCO1/2
MATQKQGISFTVAILTVVVSVILGVFFAENWTKPQKAYAYHGTVLNEARVLTSFDFPSTEPVRFTSETVKDHWTMVFYGFSHCPVMCPTTMAQLNQVYKQLEKEKVAKMPKVVMVTVDPERDTVERMHDYVKGFNPNFIGAVGKDAQIKAMTREVGIAFEKVPSRDGKAGEYDMQHSGAIIVLNPKGRLMAFFNYPHKVEDIVEDYKHLVS